MRMRGTRRAAIIAVGVFATMWLVAAPASADADTQTIHEHGVTETFVDVVPSCDEGGDLYTITITYNLVSHETTTANGFHATFTQTGTFVAVPLDPSLLSASGRFTQWGGFNENPGGAVNGTFTFSARGTFSDGTRINLHLTDHFNTTPTGAEFFFTHCHN